MGQTWSVPVVAYVESNFYLTARRQGGPGCTAAGGCTANHVLFMGSGFGDTAAEGTTFYTLDALTGNVIASVDVETKAATEGLKRDPQPLESSKKPPKPYNNALVANPAGFNPKIFSPFTTVHPAAAEVSRVYIGDVYGRVWKFLPPSPTSRSRWPTSGSASPWGSRLRSSGSSR